MALQALRLEYRVTLSNVDRARDTNETLYLARHPSETQVHATLRMLAWCLVNEERLEFGPGLSTPEAADLWTHDLTGRLTTWVECGTASGERIRKVQQHNPGVAVHVVFDETKRTTALLAELAESKLPRASTPPSLWTVDTALVAGLAARDERRQKWAVTIVGDHLYIEVDGHALDGPVARA